MNKYLFFTLVFSHLCTYLLAMARAYKKKSNKSEPEPEIIDAKTEPVTAELEEAAELLKNFEFRRIVAMHKLLPDGHREY
jgi:hypothetical protein